MATTPAGDNTTQTINLTAEVGATYLFQVVSVPVLDWTAGTATMQVRAMAGGTVVLELTEGAGLTLGATGEIDIRVEATEDWVVAGAPALITIAVYRYDLVAAVGGDTYRVAEGRVEVRPAITSPSP